jgi:hypothetical protein
VKKMKVKKAVLQGVYAFLMFKLKKYNKNKEVKKLKVKKAV